MRRETPQLVAFFIFTLAGNGAERVFLDLLEQVL
jgi:hypothetical protein